MKLLVIVLSLLSERYLVHRLSFRRFHWFLNYTQWIEQKLPVSSSNTLREYLLLACILLPPLLGVALLLWLLGPIFFGFFGFWIHLGVFYYCLGPDNPFFPVRASEDVVEQEAIRQYFSWINETLFAVIFWYIVLGPLGALFYRLIDLLSKRPQTEAVAYPLLTYLEWLPTRFTAIAYLVVGNFPRAFAYFRDNFFKLPSLNKLVLQETALLASETVEKEMTLPQAERFVEGALIVYLSIYALLILASWV